MARRHGHGSLSQACQQSSAYMLMRRINEERWSETVLGGMIYIIAVLIFFTFAVFNFSFDLGIILVIIYAILAIKLHRDRKISKIQDEITRDTMFLDRLTQQYRDCLEEKSKAYDLYTKSISEFCAIDCETIGLKKAKSRVIQIAVIKFVEGKPNDEKVFFINPGVRIPDSATKVNKITNEMLKGKPSFSDIAQEIKSLLERHPLVGHHLDFDIDMLREEFSRINISFDPKIFRGCPS
jgi:hypothetical protein